MISPRHADLPFATWLAGAGQLSAVTAEGVTLGEEFTNVVAVADYTDDESVLAVARSAARQQRPRAIVALSEVDVERAAILREELDLPGLHSAAALAYRDKVAMKQYARAAGIRVPDFVAISAASDIVDFMARKPEKAVLKPRSGSGAAGVHILESPAQISDIADDISAVPYEIEEFVDGVLHHVDAFRVNGHAVAAIASRYTGQGCLEHWNDAPFGSRTLPPFDPISRRLVEKTWQLVDALPSPPTICVHAELFVTGGNEIVLCEVAARVAGGPIPMMLKQVLGIDPRELWARVECGLPVDLEAISERARVAPLAASFGVPPQRGKVICVPEKPSDVVDFRLDTYVGDVWSAERYERRKSGDLLASWVVTAGDGETLQAKLTSTAAAVNAGFGWQRDAFLGGMP